MREALKEAEKAKAIAEVPIGAVIVKDDKVIARGHNQRETTNRAITHAELLAIDEANQKLDNWRLEDCALFVTVEPCVMCSGAIVLSRIPYVYYGAADYKGGTAGTLMNLLNEERFNHQAQVEAGILEEECRHILTSFFKELREKRKQKRSSLIMSNLYKYQIETNDKQEFVVLDSYIEEAISESGVESGLLVVYCPHTTAGITINENADPDVKRDLGVGLNKTFPNDPEYIHFEGNSDGHMKSSVVGASETIIIENGQPIFGTWQSVYFAEFDGPRNRNVYIKIIKD